LIEYIDTCDLIEYRGPSNDESFCVVDGVDSVPGQEKSSNGEEVKNGDGSKSEEITSGASEETSNSSAKMKNKAEQRVLDPEDLDDHLLHLEEILRRIHAKFYSAYDAWKARRETAGKTASPEKVGPLPDLKTIVPEIRGSVLSGLNIVFSGVVPTRTPLKQSAPYRIATALGANVTENIVDSGPCATTHLVAQRFGTAKVHQVTVGSNLSLLLLALI
jgi:RNA polymerase II subunit A-like phosphatase